MNRYSISLLQSLSKDPLDERNEVFTLPILSIEEDNGNWYFKDLVGNRAKTTNEQIRSFVFGGARIKVFGNVYFYPCYYPQYKPPSRELEKLKLKLVGK